VLAFGVFAFTSFPSFAFTHCKHLPPSSARRLRATLLSWRQFIRRDGWRKARCLSEETRGIGLEFRQVACPDLQLASPERNAFSAKMVR